MSTSSGKYPVIGRSDLGRIRARKIAMHALHERGQMRRMVQSLSRALQAATEAETGVEVRSIAAHAVAEVNHELWRMRQIRRAAFGRI